MYGRTLSTTLVMVLFLAGTVAFTQPNNVAEATTEGLSSFAGWLQDHAIEKKAERELKKLEPLIVKALDARPQHGVLVYFRIFKGPEGQRLLHAVEYSGEGTTPKAALTELRRKGMATASPPSGMQLDRDSSYFTWVTKKNGKLQTVQISPLHSQALWEQTAP